jgi:DNA-binding NarL/FixJ family response regulator
MAYNPKLGPEPPKAPAQVFVLSADSLAAETLRAALASDPRITVVHSAEDAEVLIWDLGIEPSRNLTLAEPALARAAARKQPLVALVANELAAATALQRGALGVISRRADPATLSAAVLAVRLGLCVLDAELAGHYLELPTATPEDDQADALTAREREVLDLLALGLSNKAIAARLHVSLHTVKFHVNGILAKLGVDSRTGAVARALRRGWVTT